MLRAEKHVRCDGGNTPILTICTPSVPTLPHSTVQLCLQHEHVQHLDVISTHLAVYISSHKATLHNNTHTINPIHPGVTRVIVHTMNRLHLHTKSKMQQLSYRLKPMYATQVHVVTTNTVSWGTGTTATHASHPLQTNNNPTAVFSLNTRAPWSPIITLPTLDMQTRFLLAVNKARSVPHMLR